VHSDEGFNIGRLGSDAFIVAARGELDVATAAGLQNALETARSSGARRLIADLAAVTFLDSAALGVIVKSARKLRMNGGELVVVTDDPRIVRVFEITGLDNVVRLERSLVEAVNELVGKPTAA
jgi:anti-sigma B factor antagonist